MRYFLLICFLLPSISFAKCVSNSHTVSGVLSKNKSPLSNSSIQLSFVDGLKEVIDITVVTDENGAYSAELNYSTYSGRYILGPEKCKFSIQAIQLEIQMIGEQEIHNETIKVSGNQTTYNKAFKVMDAANRSAH